MAPTEDGAPPALPDALLLLALDDERGTPARATELEPGLAGAVLVDLALRGRVGVDGVLRVTDPTPTGDAVLDAALATVAGQAGARSAQHWVGALQEGLRERITDRLVASGALRREQGKVLWVFPVTRLPAGDPAPEAAVRARLDDAVLHGLEPDARTAALAALVRATGLAGTVFPGADQRAVGARLDDLARGQWAAEAVHRAVQEAAAATMAVITATTAATIVTTTGGS